MVILMSVDHYIHLASGIRISRGLNLMKEDDVNFGGLHKRNKNQQGIVDRWGAEHRRSVTRGEFELEEYDY